MEGTAINTSSITVRIFDDTNNLRDIMKREIQEHMMFTYHEFVTVILLSYSDLHLSTVHLF